MAKNSNTEPKENLSNQTTPDQGSDSNNKKKNFRYRRNKPPRKQNVRNVENEDKAIAHNDSQNSSVAKGKEPKVNKPNSGNDAKQSNAAKPNSGNEARQSNATKPKSGNEARQSNAAKPKLGNESRQSNTAKPNSGNESRQSNTAKPKSGNEARQSNAAKPKSGNETRQSNVAEPKSGNEARQSNTNNPRARHEPRQANVNKPTAENEAKQSNSKAGNEFQQPNANNPKANKRNNRFNNRYNKKKKVENINKAKPEESTDLPLPLEEIRELKAVPEEPNVDMDFSFLEASREDIEDMIAVMDEEGNDVASPEDIKDKYKKEKVIIGSENQSGSVIAPAFFARVAKVKEKMRTHADASEVTDVSAENKNSKSKVADNAKKGHKTQKSSEIKKETIKNTVNISDSPKAGKLVSSVLTRIFLEKYNLVKPIQEEKEIIQKNSIPKPEIQKTEEIIEQVVEQVEPEEPAKEEDIYKYDKLSFDPKVQKYDKNISFETIEPVNYISNRTSLSERQQNHPAVRKVLDLVDSFLTNEIHIDHSYTILLAVSGGVDSIVLSDAMALLSAKHNYKISIAHYNHNLRGTDSDSDEKFVKQFAEKYNTKIYTANGKVRAYSEKNALSIEHAARILRYKFFERTSRNIDADFVATAHTADDSAETLLLNLLRGTGLTGLAGIPKIRTFVKNVRLIRPLLELRKEDLIAYAKERRLVWKEDKSNQLLDYTRNKVRLSLIPMLQETFNPNIIETLNRTAKLINGADEFIADMVTNSIDYVIDDVRQERFSIKTNLLETFPEFVQGEIIQQLVNKYFRLSSLPMKKIAEILELMKHQSGAIYQINKNYHVLMDRKRLIFTRVEDYTKVSESFIVEQGFENAEFSLNVTAVRKKDIKFNDNPFEEYIDKSKITKALKIRHWEEGDSFIPLGMYGRMKVSDFLTNQKVALIDKSKVLVLVSGDDIVWIVGHRVSDKFKVDKYTRDAYKIDFLNKNGNKNEQKSDGLE